MGRVRVVGAAGPTGGVVCRLSLVVGFAPSGRDGGLDSRPDGRDGGLDSRPNGRDGGVDSRPNGRDGGVDSRPQGRELFSV